MRNLAFVIWMIGWPLAIFVGQYLTALMIKSLALEKMATLEKGPIFYTIAWIVVGILLYERKKKEKI